MGFFFPAKLLFKEASMRLDYDNVVSDVERFEIAFKRTRKMVDLALEQGWDNDDLEVAFQYVSGTSTRLYTFSMSMYIAVRYFRF